MPTEKDARPRSTTVKEQQLLFAEDSLLPEELPRYEELQPAHHLSAVFDECHNYIFANEGFLKDKIFYEIVKLLVMKLYDEQTCRTAGGLQFGVTAGEYRGILADAPKPFMPRMSALFDAVRARYQGLFSETVIKLKPLTLAYVVGKLQYINLSLTPGDIKGEAFQAFVYRNQRGDRGEYFTPHPIVRLAVEMIAPQPDERIIDPACGSGGFLIQALSYVQRSHPESDRAAYTRNRIAGIEFNPDVALSATIRLAFEGGTGMEITCANALIEDKTLAERFDVILTNPPFGSKGKVEDPKILKSYLLARKWGKTTGGGWEPTTTVLKGQSPDILFIEKCLKMLRPGGRMAIVVPDGLLQNSSNAPVRHWIRSQAQISAVVSIPQEAFVPYGTGIKTSLLLLQKLPADDSACFLARIERMGYDVKGQPVYRRDAWGRILRNSDGSAQVDDDLAEIIAAYRAFAGSEALPETDRIFTVPRSEMPSRFDVEHYLPEDRKLLAHLRAIGAKPLGEIADLLTESDNFRLAGDSDIRYIAISDVDFRTLQVVSQQTIKAHEAPSRATYRVCDRDIITAVSGASTGTARQATALITEEEEGAICSNGFAVLRNVHGVDPLFLLAYMRTSYFIRQVRRLMTGHAIPAITTEDLSRVLVPVPDDKEQERIARSIASIQAMRREAFRAGDRAVSDTEHLVYALAG